MAASRHLVARLPARVRRRRRPSAGAARPPPDRGLAGPPGLARRERAAARAGVHLDQPRLRHHRLLPHRPAARRRRRPRPAGRPPATTAASGSCSTACSTTPAGSSRRWPGPWPRVRDRRPPTGSPALRPRRHGDRRLLRGPRHPGHAEPRLAAGPAVRPRRHAALAAPGDRRLAAGRRVRGAGLVLGGGAAGGPAGVRRGVDRGGDDPRRLRRLRRGVRDRLGDPVRAVARHLVRPGQRSTCTSWTGRSAGTAPSSSTWSR